jgi:hypothetical protein
MSYIELNKTSLKQYHYITTAQVCTHWYNFYVRTLRQYVRVHGHSFCLVINCSRTMDDAFILPFTSVETFYSTDYKDARDRWTGNVRHGFVDISLAGKATKALDVKRFHNAFHLLQAPSLPPL